MSDLIDRQAAIDELHKHFDKGFYSDEWWNSTHVLTAIQEVPSVEPKWIPVTERLPEETGEYLVCYINGDVSTDWYGFTDYGLIAGFDEDIVAWMPRPESYKAKMEVET